MAYARSSVVRRALLIALVLVIGCTLPPDSRPAPQSKQPPEASTSTADPISYVACGCGCCGGMEPTTKCLYRAKGDSIQAIIEADRKVTRTTDCTKAGCTPPIRYVYCD